MKWFVATVLSALLLCPFAGQAQTIVEIPIMGSQSAETPVEQPVDNTYRILVIGDALAGGLGAGLSRMAEAEPGFEIVNRFQEVSGIARPEVYDWAENLPNIMEDKNFNAVVVLIGSNDRQSIRAGDFRYVRGKAFGARAAGILHVRPRSRRESRPWAESHPLRLRRGDSP